MEKLAGELFSFAHRVGRLSAFELDVVFFHHPAVSSQRITPTKQQVIFHVDMAFGHHRGYFPSLSFYNSLLSCLGSEGQLFLQYACDY